MSFEEEEQAAITKKIKTENSQENKNNNNNNNNQLNVDIPSTNSTSLNNNSNSHQNINNNSKNIDDKKIENEVIEEGHEIFQIRIHWKEDSITDEKEKLETINKWIKETNGGDRFPISEKERQTNSFFGKNLTLKLNEKKSKLDEYFEGTETKKPRPDLYYKAKVLCFPQDDYGSKKFSNRAGDKLQEVNSALEENYQKKLFDVDAGHIEEKDLAFFDICGGPGSWIEVLKEYHPNWKGYGLSLLDVPCNSIRWYPKLINDPNLDLFLNTSGDVFDTKVFEEVTNQLKETNYKIMIMIGDGGIGIEQGEQNYQELFTLRIMFSEFVYMINILEEKGNWACKYYDTFSNFTASIIYFTSLFFDECYIVKPRRSRIVNSERYIVGLGKKNLKPFDEICQFIKNIYYQWDSQKIPMSLIPEEFLHKGQFYEDFQESVQKLCKKQIRAFDIILAKVKEIETAEMNNRKHSFDNHKNKFNNNNQNNSGGYNNFTNNNQNNYRGYNNYNKNNQKKCVFYAKGNCKFGNNCRYLHQ